MRIAVLLVSTLMLLASLAPMATAARPGDISMGGYFLWRIRCPSAGYTVEERADIIQSRINNLLTLGEFDPSTLRIVTQGNDVSIYAGQKLIITVDECTARANNTTPAGLAKVWSQRLREIYPLAMPKVPPAEKQPAG